MFMVAPVQIAIQSSVCGGYIYKYAFASGVASYVNAMGWFVIFFDRLWGVDEKGHKTLIISKVSWYGTSLGDDEVRSVIGSENHVYNELRDHKCVGWMAQN